MKNEVRSGCVCDGPVMPHGQECFIIGGVESYRSDRVSRFIGKGRGHMGRKFGVSFSWRRAVGISAAKGRLSRMIGIPLTRSGRERKIGRMLIHGGCWLVLLGLAAIIVLVRML